MRVPRSKQWQKHVGSRLALFREAVGLSAAEVARALKISPQRLSNYETGLRPLDIELATAFCQKYGATLDYLYRGDASTLRVETARRIAELEVPPGSSRH